MFNIKYKTQERSVCELLKSYKTEINPTEEQKQIINKTIGTCRFIYNFYLHYNKQLYGKGGKFMTAKAFSTWLNNEYIPGNPEYQWIKEASSKSVKSPWKMPVLLLPGFLRNSVNSQGLRKKAGQM